MKRRGFTLIELIVSAAVTLILAAALIVPSMGLFSAGQSQICLNNIHLYEAAKSSWCSDNISSYWLLQNGASPSLGPATSDIAAYMPMNQLPSCPSTGPNGTSLGSYLNVTTIGVPVSCSLHGTNGMSLPP